MRLVLIVDGESKADFELEEGSNLIGRWDPDTKSFPEVDLEDYDTDSLVSRRHAVLSIRDSKVTLEDLGSKNGTFLTGGVQLEPGAVSVIAPGGEFLVGNLKLKLLAS